MFSEIASSKAKVCFYCNCLVCQEQCSEINSGSSSTNFRVKDILVFARGKLSIGQNLSKFKAAVKVSGQVWLCNLGKWWIFNYLVCTLIPLEFKRFVMKGFWWYELMYVTHKKWINKNFQYFFIKHLYVTCIIFFSLRVK